VLGNPEGQFRVYEMARLKLFNVLLLLLPRASFATPQISCVRAVDFNAMAITHAFVFVVTTHTTTVVVLQITVLLLGGGSGGMARQIQKICSCFCLILPCHD